VTRRTRRHPDLRLTAIEGEGVALDLGSRRYFTVNNSGLDILEALAEPKTDSELAQMLTDKYDVALDRALASVQGFLERCRSVGLLVDEAG
jgi:hypothetical protein